MRVKFRDVAWLAHTVRRDDPKVPRFALATVRVANPFHVRRPLEITATLIFPLWAGKAEDLFHFPIAERHRVKAAVITGDPEAQRRAVRRNLHFVHVAVALPKRCDLT